MNVRTAHRAQRSSSLTLFSHTAAALNGGGLSVEVVS